MQVKIYAITSYGKLELYSDQDLLQERLNGLFERWLIDACDPYEVKYVDRDSLPLLLRWAKQTAGMDDYGDLEKFDIVTVDIPESILSTPGASE